MTHTIRNLAGLLLILAALRGTAETIEWPRPGRPAVLTPDTVLEVGAREEGALSLERNGQRTPLKANWSREPGALLKARASLPPGIAPGAYTLHLDSPGGPGMRKGAVHVLAESPEEYTLAVVQGVRPVEGGNGQSTFPADLVARIAEAQVQVVLMLGPLTQTGSEEDYQALESLIEAVAAPVYLCPNRSDLRGEDFARRFGNPIHGVQFGRDSFLFLGAGLPAADPRAAEFLGEAHRLRRAFRASRWSIGVAGEFGLDWDLHTQMALFVDDPLNALVAGNIAPGLGATVPWGKTVFVPPVDGPRDTITILSVTPTGIRPRKVPPAEAVPPATQVEAPAP